jgi:L-threonylcarbamoyladenylate synthase
MRTEVMTVDNPSTLPHAVDVLKNGGIIAFPTDTVYGLAALPNLGESVDGLYIVKGRNRERSIALLLSSYTELAKVTVNISEVVKRLAEKFWPGPLTVIVPRHPSIPTNLAHDNSIGVRVPDHPVALALLRLTGPLAVTSANLSGKDTTVTAQEVLKQLKGRFHLIIDGGTVPAGKPSTVLDCTGAVPVILRDGPITQEAIAAALSEPEQGVS